jgi:hypothetical protein
MTTLLFANYANKVKILLKLNIITLVVNQRYLYGFGEI